MLAVKRVVIHVEVSIFGPCKHESSRSFVYLSHTGDSGSPLTKFDDEQSRWYIVGIVSFGLSKCAVANRPAVYTRVDKYTDWLLDKIQHIDSHP